jgi:hypothetical protein
MWEWWWKFLDGPQALHAGVGSFGSVRLAPHCAQDDNVRKFSMTKRGSFDDEAGKFLMTKRRSFDDKAGEFSMTRGEVFDGKAGKFSMRKQGSF